MLLLAAAACTRAQPQAFRPHAAAPSPPAHRAVTSWVYGTSLRGRPLRVWQLGDPHAPRRVLVVGVIHGDETAGYRIALALLHASVPQGATLVVVPDANPDGAADHSRQNAEGVDLNRNFPHDWRPIGRRGDQQYSGKGPLSEPESRALAQLIRRVGPTISIWFHQPVGVVDESGGSLTVEHRFARLLGEPLRRLPRYPGSAVGWENHVFPDTTAFVVELPRHPGAALRARAVEAVLADLGGFRATGLTRG